MQAGMRKLILVFSLLISTLFLISCAAKKEDGMDAVFKNELINQATQTATTIMELDDVRLDELIGNSASEVLSSGLKSWKGVKDEVGASTKIDMEDISVEEGKDGYYVKFKVLSDTRDLNVTFGLNTEGTDLTALSFDPIYTLGEKMQNAALNTLLGMGTVFIVLIIISLIIASLKYVSIFENMGKKKEVQEVADKVDVEEVQDVSDDAELMAVISAAIAAYEEDKAGSGLVVRSIKRVKR